jgi:3-oxoadipate enol-lactonase
MPHVEVDGCRLFYRFDGPADAPVVMMSNSLGTTHRMWDPQIPTLTRRFRVLRYDRRGHGQSDAPPGPYSIERLGRDAVGILDQLGLDRVNWCGLSIGGMVGMWLGVNAPARFERLVLSNTAARMAPPEAWDARITAIRAQGMAALIDGTLERWFSAGFRAKGDPMIDLIKAEFLATPPEGYAGCCAAIRDMDQRETIAGVTVPTLVVIGALDPATPPLEGELVARRIPGAKSVTLEAAHLSNIEQPEAFSAAVLDFLGRPAGA